MRREPKHVTTKSQWNKKKEEKKKRTKYTSPTEYNKKATVIRSVSVITLNGLNTPIKRYRVDEWIRKKDTTIHCLQETHSIKKHRGWKWKDRTGMAMFIWHKVDIITEIVPRHKKGSI